MKYVAFLRAINVGGKNVIRMADLRAAFEALGFADVTTYLQSGNVLFDAKKASARGIEKRIEAMLKEMTGNEIAVMVRSAEDMKRIVAVDHFAGDDAGDSHRYVTFLRVASDRDLPLSTQRGDAKVVFVSEREVYSISILVGERYGQAGSFVESKLKVAATTRNWGVVKAIADLLKAARQ
ncbi:MAG: DUF1697 domain-containing protein [Dehalococcoidia bacterium]